MVIEMDSSDEGMPGEGMSFADMEQERRDQAAAQQQRRDQAAAKEAAATAMAAAAASERRPAKAAKLVVTVDADAWRRRNDDADAVVDVDEPMAMYGPLAVDAANDAALHEGIAASLDGGAAAAAAADDDAMLDAAMAASAEAAAGAAGASAASSSSSAGASSSASGAVVASAAAAMAAATEENPTLAQDSTNPSGYSDVHIESGGGGKGKQTAKYRVAVAGVLEQGGYATPEEAALALRARGRSTTGSSSWTRRRRRSSSG